MTNRARKYGLSSRTLTCSFASTPGASSARNKTFTEGMMADCQPNLLSNSPQEKLTLNDSDGERTTKSGHQTGELLSKIEDIFESVTDCLLQEGNHLAICLRTRGKEETQKCNPATAAVQKLPRRESKAVTFPSKSPQEAWRFTVLLRILELAHEALVTGVVTTKRDIYYRDPDLFVKQAVVDRYVDDIACTLGVERDALNVVAAAKGLVAGAFTVTRTDNTPIDFRKQLEGFLVPSAKAITDINLGEVKWILVVEKEATFRTLATSRYWSTSAAGKGILITAKGYPDIQTRQFLRFLSVKQPQIRVFALVDFDADGIGILSTYKHGSIALAHESASLSVPSMIWLGVRSSDIMQGGGSAPALMKLSARDRRIAHRMLDKELLQEAGAESDWRKEVQIMLMLNVKAEIQIMGSEVKLAKWLDGRLQKETSSTIELLAPTR